MVLEGALWGGGLKSIIKFDLFASLNTNWSFFLYVPIIFGQIIPGGGGRGYGW